MGVNDGFPDAFSHRLLVHELIDSVGKLIDAEGAGVSPEDEPGHVGVDIHVIDDGFAGLDGLMMEVVGAIALVDGNLATIACADELLLGEFDECGFGPHIDCLSQAIGRTIELENSHMHIATSSSKQTSILYL